MAEDFSFEIGFFESVLNKLPDDVQAVEILGNLYTKQGRLDEGLEMDKKAIQLQPENPTAHYNLACSYCLMNRFGEALEALARAVDYGYDDIEWLLKDKDLKALHTLAEFAAIVQRLEGLSP